MAGGAGRRSKISVERSGPDTSSVKRNRGTECLRRIRLRLWSQQAVRAKRRDKRQHVFLDLSNAALPRARQFRHDAVDAAALTVFPHVRRCAVQQPAAVAPAASINSGFAIKLFPYHVVRFHHLCRHVFSLSFVPGSENARRPVSAASAAPAHFFLSKKQPARTPALQKQLRIDPATPSSDWSVTGFRNSWFRWWETRRFAEAQHFRSPNLPCFQCPCLSTPCRNSSHKPASPDPQRSVPSDSNPDRNPSRLALCAVAHCCVFISALPQRVPAGPALASNCVMNSVA